MGVFSKFFQQRVKKEWEFGGFLDLLWTVYMYVAFSALLQLFSYEVDGVIGYVNYSL